MSQTPTETEPEDEGEPEIDFRITAAVGVIAAIVVIASSFQTAPVGSGLGYWFGVVFGALVVGGIGAAIARRIQRMLA